MNSTNYTPKNTPLETQCVTTQKQNRVFPWTPRSSAQLRAQSGADLPGHAGSSGCSNLIRRNTPTVLLILASRAPATRYLATQPQACKGICSSSAAD